MMKKILILVAALALTIGATAQEKPFTYGIKAGLTISQISSGIMGNLVFPADASIVPNYDVDATDMLIGFFVSGHFNYSFGHFFGIQPELSFSMQGGKELGTTYHFNYINVPVLFEVKPVTNFSIFVGPQIGFNIYKSETINGNTIPRSYIYIKTVDWAAVVGLQYAIMDKYLISARYNIGFSTVFDGDKISGRANRVLQFGIGYQF